MTRRGPHAKSLLRGGATLGLLAATLAGACAHAPVSPASAGVWLPVPTAPPHIVVPAEAPPPAPAPPVADVEPPRPAPPTRPRSTPATPRVDAPRAGAPAPRGGDDVRRSASPAPGSSRGTADLERERVLVGQLSAARAALSRVPADALDADAREQYETALRLASQADQALRQRNLSFAATLVEKVAGLAAGLPSR